MRRAAARGILTYHSIDASESPISVDASTFERHVRWLGSGVARVVPLAEVAGRPDDEDCVALTFDDGFVNFARDGWPRLRDHGLPATLFVVTGHAGGTNAWGGRAAGGAPQLPLLDWDAIGLLAEEGVEIGAHTMTHPHLRTADDARLADEIEGCAADIEARIGRRPTSFAYPYGTVDTRIRGAATRCYDRACTTELRLLRSGEDAHLLPRLDAYYFRGRGQLEAWGAPRFRARLALRAAARRARMRLTSGPA